MKFLALPVIFIFLSIAVAFAQGENNNWCLNISSLLNFNETPMRVDSSNARAICEGYNMSVSSIEGNLLFFSDGITIYDRNGVRMPNGKLFSSRTFRSTSIQPIIGFQNFDNPNQYHVFHIKDGGRFNEFGNNFSSSFTEGKLYYSVIDMTLNDGKGDILPDKKDILVKAGITGGMVALQGYCGSIWVLVHEYNTNRFLAFEVTEQGVAEPVISEVGTVIKYNDAPYGIGINGLYASPRHDKIVSFHQPIESTQLFDFDRGTGVVSNPITLPIESNIEELMVTSGVFSPDGNYFYTVEFIDKGFTDDNFIKNSTRFIRFNVSDQSAEIIQNSKTIVDSLPRWSLYNYLQRAPDGSIYGTIGRILYRMDNPNSVASSDVAITDSIVARSTGEFTYNLPSLVVTSTAPLEQDSIMLPRDTSLCIGQQLTLQVEAEGRQYLWQDGSTSRDYTVNAPGIYSVEVKKGNCTFRDTIQVLPYEVELTLPNDTTLCENQQLRLTPTTNANQLTWQDGSNNTSYLVNQAGTYTVTASQQGCSKSDSVVVQQIVIDLELPNDTTLCENQQLQLTPTTNANQLTWQDGSNNTSYLVNQAGTYTVTASQQGCSKSDSVVVQQIVLELELPNDTTICENQSVELIPTTNASELTWQDGSTTLTYLVNQSGIYRVNASQQGCSKSDSVVVQQIVIDLELPNDTTLCENQSVELMPTTNASDLRWQDSSTNPTYLVNQSGIYSVTASQQGCSKSDSVVVQQVVIDLALPSDTTLCEGDAVELIINDSSVEQIIWQNNIEGNTLQVETSGIYEVTLFKQGCSQVFEIEVNAKDCPVCELIVPNAFSPNQDGVNDELPWLSNCPLRFFEVQIFDRWGNILYYSNDPNTTWDGIFKNKVLENGVFLVKVGYEFEDAPKKRLDTFSVQILK